MSAYEADRRARVDLEELLNHNNGYLGQYNDSPLQQGHPATARAYDSDEDESARYPSSRITGRGTQSLDLQGLEARAATAAAVHAVAVAAGTVAQDGDPQHQQQPTLLQVPADKKKLNKLPFKLAQNPASKALKRASLRITRWGALLTREG